MEEQRKKKGNKAEKPEKQAVTESHSATEDSKGSKVRKQGQVIWEEYRKIVQVTRDQARKAIVLTALNLSRCIKGNKESFCKYISDNRGTRENAGPLQKEPEDLDIQDMEKADVLKDWFDSVFTSNFSSHTIQVTKGKGTKE